jgi:DNA-binding response OmpR family regulator
MTTHLLSRPQPNSVPSQGPGNDEVPRVLVIDDSATIRKMVEFHLAQAGYQVALAADAARGLELAQAFRPHLILLDHQLPGTTGDEVCQRLLDTETTATIPVVISSALRNRAFVQYSAFANVVDQIPKPFTPELLKSGVANALETGALVVQAQRTGCAMPETVSEIAEPALEGHTGTFALRAVLDFLNHGQHAGRLTLESGLSRVRFDVATGRIQAVYSPTARPEWIEPILPPDLAEMAPLLALTLGEQQSTPMTGLVKLLERSLADPRRLRALLRFQAAVLTHAALTAEPGRFTFEPRQPWPPLFQALPLQISLPALAVEGVRHLERTLDVAAWRPVVFARHTSSGGHLDRAGLSSIDLKIYSILDGKQDLAAVAQAAGVEPREAALTLRGLELVGQVERRDGHAPGTVLALDDDAETLATLRRVLGPEGLGLTLKLVRDRVAAQLLLRRETFDLVLVNLDKPEHGPLSQAIRDRAGAQSRIVGLVRGPAEADRDRLATLSLDGLLHRPVTEADLRALAGHLMGLEASGTTTG